MRIIGGKLKGSIICPPKNKNTRFKKYVRKVQAVLTKEPAKEEANLQLHETVFSITEIKEGYKI